MNCIFYQGLYAFNPLKMDYICSMFLLETEGQSDYTLYYHFGLSVKDSGCTQLKGTVHLKMEIQSLSSHPMPDILKQVPTFFSCSGE